MFVNTIHNVFVWMRSMSSWLDSFLLFMFLYDNAQKDILMYHKSSINGGNDDDAMNSESHSVI